VDSAEFVEAPVPRRLSRISGKLETLLTDPALEGVEDHWVHVTLTDDVRPSHPMDRLRSRFPETLMLAFAPESAPPLSLPAAPREGARDSSIALDFVSAMRGEPASASEAALLERACDACADDPEVDVLLSEVG
jgi:DNA repair protein SbcD/Mre11